MTHNTAQMTPRLTDLTSSMGILLGPAGPETGPTPSGSSRARRRRGRGFPFICIPGGVEAAITNRFPLFSEKFQGLLKQPRRRRTLRHGCLEDKEPRPVP